MEFEYTLAGSAGESAPEVKTGTVTRRWVVTPSLKPWESCRGFDSHEGGQCELLGNSQWGHCGLHVAEWSESLFVLVGLALFVF
jgi:hypothetical protein